jgi:hypothetical protein
MLQVGATGIEEDSSSSSYRAKGHRFVLNQVGDIMPSSFGLLAAGYPRVPLLFADRNMRAHHWS